MPKTEVQNKIDIKAYLSAADKFWIGGQLRSLRQARGIGVPEAARLMKGTQSQILAIESGSQGPFGSTENYVQGVLKYAGLNEITPDSALGLKLAELQAITTDELKEQSSASGIDMLMQSSLASASTSSVLAKFQGKRVLIALSGLIAVLVVILVANDLLPFSSQVKTTPVSTTQSEQTMVLTTTPPPLVAGNGSAPTMDASLAKAPDNDAATAKQAAQDSSVPVTKSTQIGSVPAVAPQSSPARETTPTSSQSLSFKFDAPCWIQTTDLNGKVTEKIYGLTDRLVLDPSTLKSIVVGNIEATSVFDSNGKPLSLKPFANQSSKVARLKEQDIDALARERN